MFSFFHLLSKPEIKPAYYSGETVDLSERFRVDEKEAYDHVPTVYFDILNHENKEKLGKIELRLKMDDHYMFYYGHIGYHIYKGFRGHHYALRACEVLFAHVKEDFGLEELIITCNPDNLPSYKTLAALHPARIETVKVPMSHELYWKDGKEKSVFYYPL